MTAFSRATGYDVKDWILLRVATYNGRHVWPRDIVLELKCRGWHWGIVDPGNPEIIWRASDAEARKKGRWVLRLFETRADDPAVKFAERLQFDRQGLRLYELRGRDMRRRERRASWA